MAKILKNRKATSLLRYDLPVGFLYWIHETHNLRGMRGKKIEEYPALIATLYQIYTSKYPNGLTGWSDDC